MTTWFVSRHLGAIEWAQRQSFHIDKWVEHLNPDDVQCHDKVIGTLPIHLAAEVCRRNAEYWSLQFEVAASQRGKELSGADLKALGATLVRYQVTMIEDENSFS